VIKIELDGEQTFTAVAAVTEMEKAAFAESLRSQVREQAGSDSGLLMAIATIADRDEWVRLSLTGRQTLELYSVCDWVARQWWALAADDPDGDDLEYDAMVMRATAKGIKEQVLAQAGVGDERGLYAALCILDPEMRGV